MADKLDPFDVEALESAVNDSATRVSTIWISFLIFSLYLLVTATTVTQRQLLLAEPVKLPALNIDLPLWGFFFLAPILFVILHAYVLLQVVLLGRTTAAYNAAVARIGLSSEENNSLRQRLANTLFAQIFAGSPREREGWLGWLLKAMAWITLAIAPILILLAFQFSFLAYHSHIATWTHRLLILFELAALFLVWPLALDAQKDFKWPQIGIGSGLKRTTALAWLLFGWKEWRDEWPWRRQQVVPLAICLLFVIFPLSIATFPGEPHVNLFTLKPIFSVQCNRWLQGNFRLPGLRFDRLNLRGVRVVGEEKLSEIEIATSKRGLEPRRGERTQDFHDRDLNCSDLSSADLRRVDFTSAHLIGASLDSTALNGTSLDKAQLQGANLNSAQLEGASLDFAELQGATLNSAELQGASLVFAKLQGADLEYAHLQGAALSGRLAMSITMPNLVGFRLGAQLQGATLDHAQLQGAYLNATNLQGASLVDAQLQGASFKDALLQGADFADANLDHTILFHAWTWRSRNAACKDAHVIDLRSYDASAMWGEVAPYIVGFGDEVKTRPISAEEINAVIESYVAEIPDDGDKQKVAGQMRKRLLVESGGDDTEALAKVWSNCEAETRNVSQEKFDEEHGTMLRNLVCGATQNRAPIAQGIVDIWIHDSERPAFSAVLARGLLGLDGIVCPAYEDFDEATKKELRAAATSAVTAVAPKK